MKTRKSVKLCLLLFALFLLFLAGCGADSAEDTAPVTTDIITFQGIPWNITPEELTKTYLSGEKLTEETPYMQHWGRQLYSVKNIRVYGVKATAVFEFRSYIEGANGLYTVYVLFPEGTDAQSIREKLTADYGEPLLYEKDYVPDVNDHAVWWEGTEVMDSYLLTAYPSITEVPETMAGKSATRLQWVDDLDNYLTIYNVYPDDWMESLAKGPAIIYEGLYTEILQTIDAQK